MARHCYVHATAGNISVRLPDSEGGGYLITPTDACLGYLKPERLARLDPNGEQISGDKGSKTIALHRKIYAVTDETNQVANCVIHTHSTHCVALTLSDTQTPELYFLKTHMLPGSMRPTFNSWKEQFGVVVTMQLASTLRQWLTVGLLQYIKASDFEKEH